MVVRPMCLSEYRIKRIFISSIYKLPVSLVKTIPAEYLCKNFENSVTFQLHYVSYIRDISKITLTNNSK